MGQDDPLEKEMAAYSSILAWKIPRTEEPGRLQAMGCKEWDTTERLNNNSVLQTHGQKHYGETDSKDIYVLTK